MTTDTIQTSPSAIETYEGCPRKWAYQSLMRVPSEPSRGQLVGRQVDEQIESVLAGRQACPSFDDRAIGEMAQKLLDMLPQNVLAAPRGEGRGQRIEQPWVRLEGARLFTIIGRPDLVYRDPDGPVLIVDFKTTSNLRYAQTHKSLPSAIQAQFYGAAMIASERVSRAHLLWLTVERGSSLRAVTAAATIDIDAAGAFVRRARDVTDRMRATKLAVLRECPTPVDAPASEQDRAAWSVEPNLDHCRAYGGCPFQTRCFGQPHSMTQQETPTMADAFSIFDQIQKNMQSVTQAVPDFPPQPPPPPPQTVLAEPVASPEAPPRRRGRPPKSEQTTATEGPAASQPPTLLPEVTAASTGPIETIVHAVVDSVEYVDGRICVTFHLEAKQP